MEEEIIIRTDDEAFSALVRAMANEVGETAQVVFEDWPVLKLTISGEDFHGSIPTRIMPPILELQAAIHRIYCQAKYNSEDTRRLRQEERELLELVVTIKPGSTEFITRLADALNEIVKNSNMNGTQVLILLISISALLAGSFGWKAWIRAKEREHGQDVTVQLSQEETRRLEIVTQAMQRQPEIKKSQESIDDFRADLSKKLKPSDQIKVQSQPVITGVRAAEIVPPPRASAEEVRIDGEFTINEVKFPKVFGGTYRFSVTRVLDGKQLTVDALPGVLSDEQIQVLKDGGFGVRPVLMEINAKELRGHISSASLLSIRWPEEG